MSKETKKPSALQDLERIIIKSDKRIALALEAMECCGDRGKQTLKALKELFKPASGLDSVGGDALLSLVQEFVKNHRRDFISDRPPKAARGARQDHRPAQVPGRGP